MAKLAERFGDEMYFVALSLRSGIVEPQPPRLLGRMLLGFQRYGLIGGALVASAVRYGDRAAIIDERGVLTYKQLDDRSSALANAWRERGLQPEEGVGILARNHRGFLEAVFAGAKCGARVVLLNTSFAGPQIREVARLEGTDLLVYDEEYADAIAGVEVPRGCWRAWSERSGEDTLDALIAGAGRTPPPKPAGMTRITILTSGTTGSPKGAPRSAPRSLGLLGGLLSKVPFRAKEVTELSVPMFHAFGFVEAIVGIGLGSTLVIRRRFDPAQTVASLREHRATALVAVPVMLQRIVELPDELLAGGEGLDQLRIILLSGSALSTSLAGRATRVFGPVVYNLYGSTEVAYATIATPEDLERAPGTVGKVVRGSVVKILDDNGGELPTGKHGRIFVANASQFEGYTGGGDKDRMQGMVATGDVGHFDGAGRLFIDGRDDEMIVSGGENVFPAEVEELLGAHDAIAEAAAIGVKDEQFGQRLKAFVVLRDGAQMTDEEVMDYVRENLARYKVPREVVFVDALPRNPTGKVLKRELARTR